MNINTKDDIIASIGSESQNMKQLSTFLDQQTVYIADNNSTRNYSNNSSTITTQSFNLDGRYSDPRSYTLVVPMVHTLTAATAITEINARKLLHLKSKESIISKMSVRVAQQPITQEEAHMSLYQNFEKIVQLGNNELSRGNYRLDDACAWSYDDAQSGITNNRMSDVDIEFDGQGYTVNKGLKTEFEYSDVKKSGLLPIGVHRDFGGDYVEMNTTDGKTWTYYQLVKIPLVDVCPFFRTCPMIKNASMEIIIRFNQVNEMVVTTTNDVQKVVSANLTGDSNPLFLASFADISNNTFTVTSTVSQSKNGVRQHHMHHVRLYMRVYNLSDEYENSLLTDPVKPVVYRGIKSDVHRSVTGNFNLKLSSNMVGLNHVLIVPQLNKDSNASLPVHESPFCSDLPSPCYIQNLNLKVGSLNLFTNPIDYSFEFFMRELANLGVDANLFKGSGSGFISEKAFNNMNRYYVIDVSRRLDSDQMIAGDYSLTGKVVGSEKFDFHVFLVFDSSATLDITTSAIRLD